MADPFALMAPGQSLESGVGPFNRDWHNAMTDLHQRTVRNRAADMTQGDVQLPDDDKFWIANVEGVILPQYSAIGLGSLLTFPDQYSDFTRRMCFITTPLVRNRPFAIIQKTLHANEFYVATTAIAAGGTQPPAVGWVRLIGDADVYNSTAHYSIGEQVTSGGITYAAIQPVDGEAVTDTSYWVPLGPRRGMWDGTAYVAGDVVAIPTLGEILIDGISRCTVIVGHASHNYAGPSELGIVSQVEPGPLEILYKNGTGEQYCVVRFCCDTIDSQTCTGSGELSLAALTSDGDGIRYGGNLITGVMTMAGVGTFSPPVCTGEDGPTLPALTIYGVGKVYDANPSGRLYFAAMAMAGAGTVVNPPSGFAWLPFGALAMAGVGTVTPPTCTGSGALTLGALKIDGGGLFSPSLMIFKTIAVSGQPDVVADSATDTLTLVAGNKITITTDPTTDAITISAVQIGMGRAAIYDSNITSAAQAWDAALDYYVNDLVSRSGVNYRCKLDHINQVPPNSTYWDVTTASLVSINIPTANSTSAGIVSTVAQQFTGEKTFRETIHVWDVSTAGAVAQGGVVYLGTGNNTTNYSGSRISSGKSTGDGYGGGGTYSEKTFRGASITFPTSGTARTHLIPPEPYTGTTSTFVITGGTGATSIDGSVTSVDEYPKYAVANTSGIKYGVWSTIAGLAVSGGIITGGTFSVSGTDITAGTLPTTVLAPSFYLPAANAGTVLEAENKEGSTVAAGMLVATHSSGTGFTLADATGMAKVATGITRESIANTVSGEVQTEGMITLADWTASTGSTTLAANGKYFADPANPGKMTTTPPTTAGYVNQFIGSAVSADTLDLTLGNPILL